MEIYCVKCKKSQPAKDVVDTVTKNGRSAKKGKCSVCGTTVCKFVASAK